MFTGRVCIKGYECRIVVSGLKGFNDSRYLDESCELVDIVRVVNFYELVVKLLEDLGAMIFRTESSVFINTEKARYSPPDPALVSKIRASTYLIGACLFIDTQCFVKIPCHCSIASELKT